jgi:uroporphyrinogen-III synthase
VLPEILRDAGIHLEQLVVYENRDVESFPAELIARLKSGTPDWIGLSSPSIARRFASLLKSAGISPGDLKSRLVAISSVTAAAARECGLTLTAEAEVSTWDGILECIQKYR